MEALIPSFWLKRIQNEFPNYNETIETPYETYLKLTETERDVPVYLVNESEIRPPVLHPYALNRFTYIRSPWVYNTKYILKTSDYRSTTSILKDLNMTAPYLIIFTYYMHEHYRIPIAISLNFNNFIQITNMHSRWINNRIDGILILESEIRNPTISYLNYLFTECNERVDEPKLQVCRYINEYFHYLLNENSIKEFRSDAFRFAKDMEARLIGILPPP